jgi:glycosyltransferase involved in cell wall biosynthesis
VPLRVAIISTHPIQYYAPFFRTLAERANVDIHVFYGWKGGVKESYDPGFDSDVQWDIPLLEGYPYTFVPNESSDPGTHHFRGLVNPELVPAVEDWDPDAILVYGWNYQAHLRAISALSGEVPVLFRGDSTLLGESPGLRRFARRLFLRWVYRFVDAALYVGTHSREYFCAHGLSDSELAWVPHAIDNKRFADPHGEHAERARAWRSELGIEPDEVVAVFAGKLEPVKNPFLLLRAVAEVAGSVHVVFAGSGALEDDLRREAETVPHAHLIGFQNQSLMPAVYRLGDILVLPSRHETWGLAVNEAMACGRPAIVSDQVGCAPDLITPGETGFVFESENIGELKALLADIATQRDQLANMGQRAHSQITEDWSIEAEAERFESAVRSFVS